MRQEHIDQIKHNPDADKPCGLSGVPASVCQCATCNPNFGAELLSDIPIPRKAFIAWHLSYFNNMRGMRYGQAFVNDHMHIKEVAALREGPYLWEDNRTWSVQSKLREKGIIE